MLVSRRLVAGLQQMRLGCCSPALACGMPAGPGFVQTCLCSKACARELLHALAWRARSKAR